MRVIIADPNDLYRAGVKSVLAGRAWAEVVGEAGDEEALVDLLEATRPDMVLLDPGIANGSDSETVAQVRRLVPDARVVVVTDATNGHIRRIVQSGADGCLLKAAGAEELTAALRLIADGHQYVQAALVGLLLGGGSSDGRSARLSAQHVEILRLVSRGLKNKQVAREFGMSMTSLKSHLRLIYAHLDVSSRVEAAAAAVRLGIVQ